MKYLCLALLLAWSGATYAASGISAPVDVPITVTGSSGPPPPPGATAAGFTTLAWNDDFTQSQPANWIDCFPSDGQVHRWYMGRVFYGSSATPCGSTAQVIDPLTGQLAVDVQWQASYAASVPIGFNTIETIGYADTSKVTDFPNAYFEIVARITPAFVGNQTPPLQAFWTWGTADAQAPGTRSPIEQDFIEVYGANSGCCDAGIHNWGNGNNPNAFIWVGANQLPNGFDFTQYHTYAGRVTSNGSTQMFMCSYVDGNLLQSCVNSNPTAAEFNYRNYLIVNNGRGSATFPDTVHFYIKSIRVWSCANWQTTMCNGSVLTGAP